MIRTLVFTISLLLAASTNGFAQNTNSSTTKPPTTRSNTNKSAEAPKQATPEKPATTAKTPAPAGRKRVVAASQTGSDAVLATFDALLDGIRHRDVEAVMGVYWNSPQLLLFNSNGTVTRGWEQVRKNRQSSYPDLKDVTLEVHDKSLTMLGRDGAVITCLWNQTQTYKGTPEAASGRMTLVLKRFGTSWKAIHLHTSSDKPNAAGVLPSEQTPTPKTSASPNP